LAFDFDLEAIVEALTRRRLFVAGRYLETDLTGALTFLRTAFFLAGLLVLACFLAMTFFCGLRAFDLTLVAAFFLGLKAFDLTLAATFFFGLKAFDLILVATFFDEVFAVFFAAFLTATDFLTGLAALADIFLLCFDTEAVIRPAVTRFFFSAFRFFEADLGRVLVAATLTFALPFCRLESVSLIRISL
jgi:hypothetical protein